LAHRWEEVVGERLARETSPARLQAGILTVSASTGPWGAQVGFLAEEVRKGANRALGTDVVRGVRVVVDPGGRGGPKPL
jgi:predicted nucleic acid-binding Zn ribbon protein